LEEGLETRLRELIVVVITFHAMEHANRQGEEEELKAGIIKRVEETETEEMKEEGTNQVEDKAEANMEDRTIVRVEDRAGMEEEKKAEARVGPARQAKVLGSVRERSCRHVLTCAQDFLQGSSVLVWQAVPRGVQEINKYSIKFK